MTRKKKEEAPGLVERLDQAAEILLTSVFPVISAQGEATSSDGGCTVADKIKAFAAISNWASERTKLIVPEKGQSKGERLRKQFQHTTLERRAGGSEDEGEPGDRS